jgi:hypothetical protein
MLILDSSTTLVGVDACRKTDLGRSDFSHHGTFGHLDLAHLRYSQYLAVLPSGSYSLHFRLVIWSLLTLARQSPKCFYTALTHTFTGGDAQYENI